jgi:hypothetical protein
MPAALRARLAADYAPVRPLAPPIVRLLWMAPLAGLLLIAAPWWFDLRVDAGRLGAAGSWGASLLQIAFGLAMVGAGLREAVPGRQWSLAAVAAWFTLPLALVVAVTCSTWSISPTRLGREWWAIGSLCFGGSAASALPAIVLGSRLASRAFPTRPAVTGALVGCGAGLMADAGWRLFCHFSEPAHVLSSHAAGVLLAALLGMAWVEGTSARRPPAPGCRPTALKPPACAGSR